MRFAALIAMTVGLSFSLIASASAQDAASSQDQQVQRTLKTCFQCHGENGVSRLPSRPSIAGQKADYVARQLFAFKRAAEQAAQDNDGDGDDPGAAPGAGLGARVVRTDPVMQHMALALPDELIVPLSKAVGALDCAGGNAAAQKGGQKAGRKAVPMPAIAQRCAVCHGADGIGVERNTPNVAGQQRAYLRRQLLLIRETAWGAEAREGEEWRTHPIMERQAARLKIEDVDGLASFYAGLDCHGVGPKTPEGLATE